jgi:glyoxylase-like metal-dependent hydrolase (beta-lactamase superfamily II)
VIAAEPFRLPPLSEASHYRQTVSFVWERLAEGVHRARLPFLDVTVGLVESDAGALLVDTGTTLSEAAAIDADVRSIANSPVTRIILTHKHFDHILGSSAFTRAEIYCSPEVAAYMSARVEFRADALRHGADAAEVDRAIAALRRPDHVVYNVDVDLGDRSVSIRHPGRGHTHADLIVVVPPADATDPTVVFCGDLVEESGDPVIDVDSDLAAWPETLDRLLEAGGPDAVYVPGHGAVVDAGFIRRQRTWLQRRL